jgi:hypothetical protein
MGGKKWEQLQQDVNLTLGPLLQRGDYYKSGVEALRQVLTTYFLNPQMAAELVEPTGPGQQLFDFNQFKEKMSACLVHEETLAQYAGYWQGLEGFTIGRRGALNTIILNSGLPFECVEGSYLLKFAPPFTPKAAKFMQQFAHALSIYGVYLGIVETYQTLLNYPFINSPAHLDYLPKAQSMLDKLPQCEDEPALKGFFRQAKSIKKEIKQELSLIYLQKEEFANAFLLEITNLVQLFEEGKKRLEQCYKEFPNTSYTCWLYDTNWQYLLKTVAGNFFNNQYTYWSSTSTLTILPQFTAQLCDEIGDVHRSAMHKQFEFKVELLSESTRAFDDLLTKIRALAAKNNVSLLEAPSQTIFDSTQGSTVYHLYYQLMLKWQSNGELLRVSLTDNEEIVHENDYLLV